MQKPLDRLKKLNTKDSLWIYILSLLKSKELYGCEIPSLIEQQYKFKPGRITPYRVLYRLEQQKLVVSKFINRKRMYKITDHGNEQLISAKIFYKNLLEKL